MSSLNEMNEALRRQTSYGQWATAPAAAFATAPAANVNHRRAGIVETLVRAMKRRRTANLLRQLDSRLLDDIGIIRGDIDQVAAKAAAETVAREGIAVMPRVAALTQVLAVIFTGVANAWKRQSTIVALQRLSNHTLADIGIERGRIPEIVEAMMAQDGAKPTPVRTRATAKAAAPKTAAPKSAAKPVETAAPAPAQQVAA